ncbi:MAG: hypothetical protein NWQ09_08390, partial [Nonlabens sp.]|nr:hypothetical protein [Nonlabens sp.]
MKTFKTIYVALFVLLSYAFAKAETPPTQNTIPAAVDWTGTYNTSFGEIILLQKGPFVVGTYKDAGTIRSLANVGNDLFIEFDNKGKLGYAKWTRNGTNFNGTWGWTNKLEQGTWTGSKTKDAVQYYIKGTWKTKLGELDFIDSKTGMMAAHYGTKGGMVWGTMNHSTKIFNGNYRHKSGAAVETCSFIFKNTTFEGKYNNTAYGSWNGERVAASTVNLNSLGTIVADSSGKLKFKITLNSYKCNAADNIRNREKGFLSLGFRVVGKDGLRTSIIEKSHYEPCEDYACYFVKTNDRHKFKEGVDVKVNEYIIQEYDPNNYKSAENTFYFSETVFYQKFSEERVL